MDLFEGACVQKGNARGGAQIRSLSGLAMSQSTPAAL